MFTSWEASLEDEGLSELDLSKSSSFKLFDSDVMPLSEGLKLDYYLKIFSMFHMEQFENEKNRKVIELWSQGKNKSEITRTLDTLGLHLNRETIRYVIRRFEHKWGIRNWTLKQLHLKAPIK
jgi:predicted metal-dependent hydrolase